LDGNYLKVSLFLLTNYLILLNNFDHLIDGKFLLIIYLFINIIVAKKLKIDSIKKFTSFLFITITLTNLLFDEIYLLSFDSNQLTYYLNILSLGIVAPLSLIYLFEKKFYLSKILGLFLLYEVSCSFLGSRTLFTENIEYIIFSLFLFLINSIKNYWKLFYLSGLIFMLVSSELVIFYLIIFAIIFESMNKQHYKYLYTAYFFILYIFQFNTINNSLKNNFDNYVYFFSGLRSNYLDVPVLLGTIDNKGFFFYQIYKYLIMFVESLNFNQWYALYLGLGIIAFVYLYCLYRLTEELNFDNFSTFVISFIFINNLFFSNFDTVRLGARFVGSIFLFLFIYNFIKKHFFLSGVFLILSNFVIISFLIPSVLLIFFLLLNKKINLKFLTGMIVTVTLSFLYLFLSEQLYFQYLMQIKYIFSDVPLISSKFGFKNIIFSLFSIFLLIFLFFDRQSKFDRENLSVSLFMVWFVGEIFHVLLTNSRFDHYKNLLIIPSTVILLYLLNNFRTTDKFYFLKPLIVLVIIYSSSTGFLFMKSPHVNNYNLVKYQQFNFLPQLEDPTINLEKSVEEFSYGIYFTDNPEDFNYFYNNFNIIPSTNGWVLIAADLDFSTWINKSNFLNFFYEDMKKEDVEYIILKNDYLDNYGLDLLTEYQDKFNLQFCTITSCFFKADLTN